MTRSPGRFGPEALGHLPTQGPPCLRVRTARCQAGGSDVLGLLLDLLSSPLGH